MAFEDGIKWYQKLQEGEGYWEQIGGYLVEQLRSLATSPGELGAGHPARATNGKGAAAGPAAAEGGRGRRGRRGQGRFWRSGVEGL